MYCTNTKCPHNVLGLECTKAVGIEFNCKKRNNVDDNLRECSKCIHKDICKNAESLDGYAWKCSHYREDNDWIPVDNPPEEDGCYIVAVENEHERRYSKTAWYTKQTNSWFARQKVTHWMPLPFAPQK